MNADVSYLSFYVYLSIVLYVGCYMRCLYPESFLYTGLDPMLCFETPCPVFASSNPKRLAPFGPPVPRTVCNSIPYCHPILNSL
jgi:hypothetical protein